MLCMLCRPPGSCMQHAQSAGAVLRVPSPLAAEAGGLKIHQACKRCLVVQQPGLLLQRRTPTTAPRSHVLLLVLLLVLRSGSLEQPPWMAWHALLLLLLLLPKAVLLLPRASMAGHDA